MSVQRTFPVVPLVACLAIAACADPASTDDSVSGFEREVRGGRIHADLVPSAARARDVDVDVVIAIPALQPVLGTLGARDLDEIGRVVTTDASSAALVHVQLAQRVDGIPIHGAYLHLTVRPADSGELRLLASSYHLYQGAQVDTGAEISSDGAEELARAALRAPTDAPLHAAALEIWPIDGALALVWDVTLEGHDDRALVRANGPRAGVVEVVDERVEASSGTASGWLATGGAPGGAGVAHRVALTDLAVRSGSATAYTSATGHFAFSSGGAATVTALLTGKAARITDMAGANVGASAQPGTGVALTLGDKSEGALAQVTAYQTATDERAFLVANGFPTADLGAALAVRVNVDDSCNAYFSPTDRTLNFFRAGGGCRNSAERSIIGHEYGHFVDDAYGGILDQGLSEGWGDTLSCLFRSDPVIGPDLMAGQIIRTCDNDYVYPSDGQDEIHALGQAWSGFVWNARAGLIRDLGADAGDALIRKLVLPSLRTNAADIPSAVREVFLRDDDDGDLGNGTPHGAVLMAAAKRHGLDFAIGGDTTAPGAVTDLHATAVHAASVTMSWTAPDDGDGARAARYEIRWSKTRITEARFPSATKIAAPKPAAVGHAQHLTIAIPPGATRIYVALRAFDTAGNASPLSNVALVHPTSPKVAFDGSGDDAWTVSGLWHATSARAAPSSPTFGYADDATGTYDTGAATHGDLVSPVIDLAGVDHPMLAWSERMDVEGDARFDRATVTVVDVADPTRSVTAERATSWTGGVFEERGLDLDALADRRVRVTFHFDSIDGAENRFAGWAVSNARILADDVAARPTSPLVIDEILADPPAGYDANGDGVASTTDDEFVELVNTGATPFDLGGHTLEDATRVRLTFPAGTSIDPGKALVVFGGGAPAGSDVTVLTAPAGLILNNAGDTVRIRTPDGEIVAEVTYGPEGGKDQSLVRSPEGNARSPFVGHRVVSAAPASPGRRSDGSAW